MSASSVDLAARCVIHGMSGVGKTRLTLQYAKLASGRSQYVYTFWVSVRSVKKLARDFAKLVDLLRLPKRCAMDQVTKLTTARAWLEHPTIGKNWLLVLDNMTQVTMTMIFGGKIRRRSSRGRLPVLSAAARRPPSIDPLSRMLSLPFPRFSESPHSLDQVLSSSLLRRSGQLYRLHRIGFFSTHTMQHCTARKPIRSTSFPLSAAV